MTKQTTSEKITIGLILSWICGVLFALTGIISVFSEPIQGLVMLIIAAFLLPPFTKLLYQKWKFHLSGAMKIVLIIIGFIFFGETIAPSNISNMQQAENYEQFTSVKKTKKTPTYEETPKEKLEPTKRTNVPAEYKSALAKAYSYANDQHMSKKRLYDQLTSEYGEQFSKEEAQYAVDNVKTDWKENALAKAKSYQDGQNMSPAAIYDQLTSEYGEQFTNAEANYAIQHLND